MTMQRPYPLVISQKPNHYISPGGHINGIFSQRCLQVKGSAAGRAGRCEGVVVIPPAFAFVRGQDKEIEAVLWRYIFVSRWGGERREAGGGGTHKMKRMPVAV